jgi:hypothetical protein
MTANSYFITFFYDFPVGDKKNVFESVAVSKPNPHRCNETIHKI